MSADAIVWCHVVVAELLEVVGVVYMQKWTHLVQRLRRNEYFQSHFLQISFFAAGSMIPLLSLSFFFFCQQRQNMRGQQRGH